MTDYYSEAFRNKVKDFLDHAPFKDTSMAKMLYSTHLYGPKIFDAVQIMLDAYRGGTPGDEKREKKKVQNIDSVMSVKKWMARDIANLDNHQILWDKMLEFQEELDPRIKRKCLTQTNEFYRDNMIWYFFNCEKNPCSWIMENLDRFKDSESASLLCVIVGFRGEVGDMEPMMERYAFYSEKYPKKDYNQGPLYAVDELSVRFFENGSPVPANNERKETDELLKLLMEESSD